VLELVVGVVVVVLVVDEVELVVSLPLLPATTARATPSPITAATRITNIVFIPLLIPPFPLGGSPYPPW
jgi:hypothetical protein